MANLETIPLELIDIDPLNARAGDIAFDDPDLVHLTTSMRELGLLQPIVVRRNPDTSEIRYYVTAGKRRFLAARKLEWDTIKAVRMVGDAGRAGAISAAENMARAAMHPVDEWLAVAALIEQKGWAMDGAAHALGIDPTHIPRMRQLARMAPEMLDAIKASRPAPVMGLIRTISLAPHDIQRAALAENSKDGVLFWHRISEACTVRRIPMSMALFDVEKTPISFEEDMFAEADTRDRLTTTDVAGFLKAQRLALDAETNKIAGHAEVIELIGGQHAHGSIPKGWEWTSGDIPKRWRKADPRKVFFFLHTGGFRVGEVERILCEPTPQRAGAAPAIDPAIGKQTISKGGLDLVATMKGDAVREALAVLRGNGPAAMLHVMLLTFLYDNVRVSGSAFTIAAHISKTLIDPDGNPRKAVGIETLCTLAAGIAGTALRFDSPTKMDGSGRGADWMALAIGAAYPRCDSAKVLANISLTELQRLAFAAGISTTGTAKAIRERLVNNLPDWQPAPYRAEPSVYAGIMEDDDDGE